MPLEVSCSSCSGRFRVPDTAAGKKIKCPKCTAVIVVPAAATAAPTAPAPAAPVTPAAKPIAKATPLAAAKPKPDLWHLKTEDGETYGPVPREELNAWYAEGRITVDSQLLKDGSQQWQWASDLYPELLPPEEQPAPTPPPTPTPPPSPKAPTPPPASGSASGGFNFAFGDAASPPAEESGSGGFNFGGASAPAAGGELSFGTSTSSSGVKSKTKSKSKSAASGEKSDKSRILTAVICWLAGGLGVHRFYLGYTKEGVIQLLTCGGCGIWALIDFIMILMGKLPDAQGRPLKD